MSTPQDPWVTVVIPNYNHAETLALCLDALKEQTYTAMDVIVVEDRSTDNSREVAEARDVQVVDTPRNSGCGVARNIGAAQAKGDILFFLDSDVALAPDAVANAVDVLLGDPRIGAVGGVEDPEPLLAGRSRVNDYRAIQYHHWSKSAEGEVSILWVEMCAMWARVFADVGPFSPDAIELEEVEYGERLSRRYALRLSSRIHGRQDYDHRLFPLLRKLFRRARLRVPLYVRRGRFARGYETSTRAFGAMAALFAVLTLPLPWVLGAGWAAVPVVLAGGWLASDPGLYRLALRQRGVAFTGYLTGVHFLVSVSVAAAVLVGAVQWLFDAKFRRSHPALRRTASKTPA